LVNLPEPSEIFNIMLNDALRSWSFVVLSIFFSCRKVVTV
jgi:hypothetical protein